MLNFLFIKSKFDRYSLAAVLLVSVFACTIFFGLGDRPLIDYDEGIYSQVAVEADHSSFPLGFTWLGNLGLGRTIQWYEKPPLMIWLINGSYQLFGVNEFAARLPVTIFALLTFILVAWLARKLSGYPWAGIFAAAALGICYQYVHHAGVLQFDIAVGFFITLAIGTFILSLENPKYWYGFWLSLALAVMTKSVVGLVPLIPLGLYWLISGQWQIFKQKQLYIGAFVFLLVTVPWHLAEWLKFGHEFWDQYLFYHLIARFKVGLENNLGDHYFYWNIIKEHRLLIYLAVPALIYSLWNGLWQRKWLAWPISIFAVLIFFSLAKTKLPAYILPIYPLLSVMIGMAWAGAMEKFCASNWLKTIGGLAVVFVLLFFAIRFVNYDKQLNWRQYLIDSKEVGLYMRTLNDLPIYYYSRTGTRPSVIFYSNRIIYYLPYPSPKPAKQFYLLSEVAPDFETAKPVYKTPSQTIYLVD